MYRRKAIKMKNDYISLMQKNTAPAEVIKSFFYANPEDVEQDYSDEDLKTADKEIFAIIHGTGVDALVDILNWQPSDESRITTMNIPQFSSLDVMDEILSIVATNPDEKYANIGYYFNKSGNEGSWAKYGENHYKITAALGLVYSSQYRRVNHLGKDFLPLDRDIKEDIRAKLFLRIPIILAIMTIARERPINVTAFMSHWLSLSTVERRRSNVKKLITKLVALSDMQEIYQKNILWK